jgi:hypothetical protein
MPCYRCGVRQTDPGRGQSPWKRGVRRYSQILICPGCQDRADWMAELDRCSQCSSVHLVKRLGEVECRDCGAIVPPEAPGEPGYPGVAGEAPAGTGPPGLDAAAGPGLAGPEDPGPGGAGERDAGLAGAGLADAGRGSDLSEEVARALDRVLGRSLVSQSLQRSPDPGSPDPADQAGPGPHRPARTSARHHTAAHPGTERHRAARPGETREGTGRLDEVRPGAFAG